MRSLHRRNYCSADSRDTLVRHAADLLLSHMARRASLSPMPPPAKDALSPGLPPTLPDVGVGGRGALAALAPVALDGAAHLDHPGYLAHMDPAAADVACAAALWQVATNQNLLHPDAAPAARGLEQRVIEWLAPYFGMHGGHLVPGSTVANLTALWAARELSQVTRIISSDRSHNSIAKAAHLLGLRHVVVPSDPQTHRCDFGRSRTRDALGDLSDAAVVLTAGTVATGAVDVLERPASAAWVHVDAAWSAPMRLSPALASVLDGIEVADSVGFSAHKWLYQPKVLSKHAHPNPHPRPIRAPHNRRTRACA